MPRLVVSKWSAVPVFARALQPVEAASDRRSADGPDRRACARARMRRAASASGRQTPDSEPFVSAYAMHFLLEARDRGVAVPADMIDAGNKYLQLAGARGRRQLAGRAAPARLCGLSADAAGQRHHQRSGRRAEAPAGRLSQRWKNDLAAAWLAASYKMLKQDKEADALIAGPQRELERERAARRRAIRLRLLRRSADPRLQRALSAGQTFPRPRQRHCRRACMENISRPLEDD